MCAGGTAIQWAQDDPAGHRSLGVHEDRYDLLGVPPTVGAPELRRAYETKLGEASRHGALKRAQALDRAYALLRDDRRRALYDRHGIEEPMPRMHPMQRYAPPTATPFRQWSPTVHASDGNRPPCPDPKTGRRVALACLAITLVSWGSYAWTQARGDQTGRPTVSQQIEVVCDATPSGARYVYLSLQGAPISCGNGATARWAPVPQSK